MYFFPTLFRACIGALVAALLFLPPTCADAARKPAANPAKTAAAPTAPAALLPETFRQAIEQGIANGAYRSVAIGVIDGAQRKTFYFGQRDGAATAAADDNSRFEIGSVSEVFTGLLLAEAAIEGKVHLRDSLRLFLPSSFPFGDTRLAEVSLEALATQHSALPALPASLFPGNLDDPYADFASEDLLAFLAFFRSDPPLPEDAAYDYSVLNAGLLGHLLGRVYAAPYAETLNTKILVPLGLKSTNFGDEALLPGHARGEIIAHWHYGVLAGAAGLRSTLPDLLDFMQCNLTPGDSPLRAALLLARQARAAGATDQLGLGWNVREVAAGAASWPLIWRASETAGFSTFVGFRTDQQKAIVVMGNAAEELAGLGIAWLSGAMPPAPPHGYAAAGSNDLAAYPGLYRVAAGNDLIVRVERNSLSVQLPGQLPQRLRAVDKDVFAADVGVIGVTFMRNVDEVTGLVLHLNGNHASAQRLSEHAPRVARAPIPLDKSKRNEILGNYRLDEGTWMRVAAPAADVLTVQLTMSERRAIFAYAADRFSDADGALDVMFKRNSDGHIVGATLDLAGAQREAVPLQRPSP
jgi:CubicO group peptidase (beta-lactamase class C family)